MTDGVRAELAIHRPSACPLATLSSRTGARITDVTWAGPRDGEVTEQFRVSPGTVAFPPAGEESDGEASGDGGTGDSADDRQVVADAEAIVDLDDERVYQFTQVGEADCACEVVRAMGVPVTDVRAEAGVLSLTLHLGSLSRLQAVVEALEAVAGEVEVRYLLQQSAADSDEEERTVVDLSALTDRQREVMQLAYEMGYFDYPREANATEVAEALDIDVSTFVEHLTVAQSKLLDGVLPE